MKNLFLLLSALLVPAAAIAADSIAAVVNDQVITRSQLQARAELNLRQVGLAHPTPQQKAAITQRSLSNLIDEELQRQYAQQSNIDLTKQDIATAVATAKKNMGDAAWTTLTAGGLQKAAEDKIAAETRWHAIVEQRIQPRVQVSTGEADQLIAELGKSKKVEERAISIIMLEPSTTQSDDKTQLQKINDIKQKIANGENFADLARANSDDKSAAQGGKLGWFKTGELNPELESALDKMKAGEVSDPIRTPTGWYLVKLDDVRTSTPVGTQPVTQLEVYLLAAPTPKDAKEAKALDKTFAKTLASLKKPQDVRDFFSTVAYKQTFPASSAPGWIAPTDLEATLAAAATDTKTGRWSKPLSVNGTTAYLYVADTRQVMPEKLEAYRENVLNNLFASRVDLEARRFMQTLRQRAFLDIRH